jgi:DNA-binding MarR family transcriptional regulator
VKDLSPEEYRALAEFRFRIRKFLHFSEQRTRALGVEPQQHQLLLAVRGLPEGKRATVGELAERLQLKHHSAVELVNRLEASGAVRRAAGADDAREVLIHLTRPGGALLRKLALAHRAELDSAGPELIKALRAIMRKPAKTRQAA